MCVCMFVWFERILCMFVWFECIHVCVYVCLFGLNAFMDGPDPHMDLDLVDQLCMHACMCVCVHTYTIQFDLCMYAFKCTRMGSVDQLCMHACIHAYVCKCIPAQTNVTYACTHVGVHVCSYV